MATDHKSGVAIPLLNQSPPIAQFSGEEKPDGEMVKCSRNGWSNSNQWHSW